MQSRSRPSASSENSTAYNITYDNLTVTGYNEGIELPLRGNATVNGGTYNNNYDLVTFPATATRNIVIQGFLITPKIASWSDLNPLPHNESATLFFANDVVTL